MPFELRQYQIDALETIHNDLQTSKEVLLQAIMGAGKTVIVCRLINRYYFETDRRFLILCHKQELVEQFQRTFKEKTDIPLYEIGVSCAGLKSNNIKSRVTIGTIQTFIGKIDKYSGCNLLVIDEAHRIDIGKGSQYDTVIGELRKKNVDMRIIGITATPYRLGHGYIYGDKCKGQNLFQKMNHQIKYEQLKSDGYLMPLFGKIAVNSNLSKDIQGVKTSGDYILYQLSEVMTKQIHLQTAVDAINQYCGEFKHICVFCCTIDHAQKLKTMIGNECTIVHSQLSPMERLQNMEEWKSGNKRIITSINILAEGFDFPPLDCLVSARPTLSSSLYLQMIGRVLRTSTGKEKAFLLDLTGNTDYFGSDLDNIKVTIPKSVEDAEKEKRKFEKECPECHTWIHIARWECPNCAYQFPMKETTEVESLPDMQDIRFNEPIEYPVFEVVFMRHQKKDKPDSVRIEYHNTMFPFKSWIASDWLCFEHGGTATNFAKEKWIKFTGQDWYPENTTEALLSLKELNIFKKPESILVKSEGKFKRIIDYKFPENCNHKSIEKPIEKINVFDKNTEYELDDIPF